MEKSFLFSTFVASILIATPQDNNSSNVVLDEVNVIGSSQSVLEKTSSNTISKEKIEHSPSGNGDMTSLLRVLPNVQFNNTQRSSKTPGEIAPADISISGGQTYQNLFLVDGVSMNNDLNPAYKATNQWSGMLPGRSQGMALDTSLIEDIKVIDSNAGAEYGGFSGGIVEANTKRPTKDFGFKISHQYTNGKFGKSFPHSFSKYHMYGNEEALQLFRDSYDENSQPEFTKHITKATIESIINDKWNIIGQFGRTYSNIPLRRSDDSFENSSYQSPSDDNSQNYAKQDQKRYIYNYFLKAYYDPTPDLGFEFSYTYAPDKSRQYLVGTVGDFYDFNHGGHIAMMKTNWDNPYGTLTNTLSASFLRDEQASNYSATKYWQTSATKNWSNWAAWNREGGHVPRKSNQISIVDKIMQEFKPFEIGSTTHTIKAGLDLEHIKADFKYTKDFWLAVKTVQPMTKEQLELCKKGGDYSWCDPSPVFDPRKMRAGKPGYETININGKEIGYWPYGQYFNSLTTYSQDKISLTNNQISAFVENNILIPLGNYGDLTLRPGVRLDYDSYTKNTNWAHRFAIDYGFAWNKISPNYATHLIGGINRYYGRNMYTYKLNDEIYGLATTINRSNPDKSWTEVLNSGVVCDEKITADCISKSNNSYVFSKLKTPYADELLIGLSQDINIFNATLKYIHRKGEDEVVPVSAYMLGMPIKAGYSLNDPNTANARWKDTYTKNSNKYGYGGGAYPTYKVYANEGKSKTDVISLMIQNDQALKIGRVSNIFSLAFDWTNVKRNKADYTQSFSEEDFQDDYILWQGKLIHYSERPADNFVKPYSIKLNTYHDWNMLGGDWHLNNLFLFRKGYKTNMQKYDNAKREYIYVNGKDYGVNQDLISVYETRNLPSTFTWDLRIGADYKVYGKNTLFFNIDVFNVLDKKNVGTASLSRAGDLTPTYENGRQVWLEVGYKY